MQGAVDPIQLRGSRHGILVSVREDVDFAVAMQALGSRLGKGAGGEVTLDLGWREITDADLDLLSSTLTERGVRLLGIVSTSLNTRAKAEGRGHKAIIGRLGLAQHQGRAIRREAREKPPEPEPAAATAPAPAESLTVEPTLMLRRTMRSGQTVRYGGNVVVMGDVNPGASIEADGDVIVLGSLRGQAHAGATGREGSIVMAMGMHPTQLRIGDLIWHGGESGRHKKPTGPMRASVAGDAIKVEPFSA